MSQPPKFINETLRLQALTHRSFTNENPGAIENNERLKFLGNSLLAFLLGEILLIEYPEFGESQLLKIRANLLDERRSAALAEKMGLGQAIRLGKGAVKERGRRNPAILSEAFSALVAAYYLDAGMGAARDYVEGIYGEVIQEALGEGVPRGERAPEDPKNLFQQWTLAKFTQNPEYQIISESGPPHDREFVAVVKVNKLVYGKGSGKRKQDATKAAARAALKNVGLV